MTSSSSSPFLAISSPTHLHITTTTTPTTSHHHQSSRPPPESSTSSSSRRGGAGTGTGGGGGGTNQACAACKYQRRKCNPTCPLAPYFPADQQRRFLNAHRLFGVSNIFKTLRRLRQEHREHAMRTLIYEAETRSADPAGGCLRVILELEQQLELDTAELDAILRHIAICRQSAAAATAAIHGPCADLDVATSSQPPLFITAGAEQEVVGAMYINQEPDTTILQPDHHQHQAHSPQGEQQQQQLYDYFYYETVDTTAAGADDDDANSKPSLDIGVDGMQLQHFDYDDGDCAADHKVELEPPPPLPPPPLPPPSASLGLQVEDHHRIDQKEEDGIKPAAMASLVGVVPDMMQEQDLHVVDMNAEIDINAVIVDVNADIDVKEERQDEDAIASNSVAVGDQAAQMAEASDCRLELGFSSL